MLKLEEYASYDAISLADLVRKREVSPDELLDTAIAAVSAVNGDLNCVLTVMQDDAAAAIRDHLPNGPLKGVPFLIKECMLLMKGAPYRLGSRLLDGYIAQNDTELMLRYRRAGLVTFGTTSTPECAYSATTEPLLFGAVRNPWSVSHSAGGSSGGSAAAVAAGIVPIAHGNDGGGSIRIPASCCGLVGLKPTRHRVPQGPNYGEMLQGLSCEFAITRTVRDAAEVLDAVQGADVGAKNVIAPPLRPYREEIAMPHQKKRIAMMDTSFSGTPVDREIVACLHSAAAMCEQIGYEVVVTTLDIDWEMFSNATHVVWCTAVASMVDKMAAMANRIASPEFVEAATWACYLDGKASSAEMLINALDDFNTISRGVGAFFTNHDLLMTPTLTRLPLRLGELNQNSSGASAKGWTHDVFDWANFTPLFNTTGQPAISLPLGMSDKRLPIGVQFVAPMNDEASLLRIAAELEIALPWKDRRPSVHVGKQ